MNNEVGGKRSRSRNQEGLSGVDQHKQLPANRKNTMNSSINCTAKQGRNASLHPTKSATLKQQSTQKGDQQAGQSTKKIGGLMLKKVNSSTTISSTGTRVTHSQTRNSNNAKLGNSSISKNNTADTAAKVSKIVTRSNKGCHHSPSPAPELDM